MAENRKKVSLLELRAKLPFIVRALALGGLAVSLIFVVIGFYTAGAKKEFTLESKLASLSTEQVAVVDGYERRETQEGVPKYYIRADRAITFSDQHQEFENVYLELYGENDKVDKISAAKGVHVPVAGDPQNFDTHFMGSVNIETGDGLKVQTEELSYNRASETATSEAIVNFSRENVSGKALGAVLKIKEKKLDLLQNVEVDSVQGAPTTASAESNPAGQSFQLGGDYERAKILAGHATVLQEVGRIELSNNVQVNITPKQVSNNGQVGSQPTEIRAARAVAYFKKEVERIDLAENVSIVSKPMAINAAEATYFLKGGKVFLNGNAQIAQGTDLIKGDTVTADLTEDRKIKNGLVRGNAYIKTTDQGRQTEVNSNEVTVLFDNNQNMQNAVASGNVAVKSNNADSVVNFNSADSLVLNFIASAAATGKSVLQKMTSKGNSTVTMTPIKPEDYSQVAINAPSSLVVLFQQSGTESVVKEMTTGGRTSITMSAPNGNDPKASNRKIIADTVKTYWNATGKDLTKTEAIGNAELYVEPVKASPDNYHSTVNAARFDCDFYAAGNIAKTCVANGKPKVTMKPTQPSEDRGTRTLTAAKLTANFNQKSQDVERFDAAGQAKFSENDRRGTADTISYTATDETVRLRGGDPTVWDSAARVRGNEIDWNTKGQRSFFRGKVSTTYYSQKQTNGSTPFTKTDAPVFITSDSAEFDHKTEVGVYTGNARAWQDSNYVRANTLVISQKNRQMKGNGNVQSVLYNARRTDNGKEASVPVFASSEQIAYSDDGKLLQLAEKVDIRQGTDRIISGNADIFLTNTNDLSRMTVERDVQITQPGKKATGTWAQYNAQEESFILRGNPASVESAEEGSTQSAQITMFKRENRVINESSTKPNSPNRTRSVYKVKGRPGF